MRLIADEPTWLVRSFGPLAIALTFVALVAWTWETWPDVFVDFGREFYVPMRLSQGAVLYRDLAYFNGPFSPYFNALCLGLFGASLRSLFLVNIVLLALLTTLLYRMLARIGDRFSALLGVLFFLPVFAFGQLTGFGNYNFIAPYSHEVTHGVILGIAALSALARWRGGGEHAWLAVAGACVGLALLTKPETAASVLFAAIFAFACFSVELPGPRRQGVSICAFVAAILAPVLLAAGLLALNMPVTDALASVAKPWTGLRSGDTTSLAFYRNGMGLDRPVQNIASMLAWSGYLLLAFSPAIFAAWKLRDSGRRVAAISCVVFAVYAIALLLLRDWIEWTSVARPLPLFVAVIFVLAALNVRGGRGEGRFAMAVGLAVLSFVLLAKMLLNARIGHYGFALAFPAMMLVVSALASWLPTAIDRRGGEGNVIRAAATAAIGVFAFINLQVTAGYRAEKTVSMGSGGDAFKADIRGNYMNSAVLELAATPADSTLAVLPEGVMLNVLAHRQSPLRFVNFMPPEVLLFGEDAMLADITAHPPDRIVLVHKDTSEYGLPFFGRDYGTLLMAWIHANYSPEALIGDPPLEPGSDFGLLILARKGSQRIRQDR